MFLQSHADSHDHGSGYPVGGGLLVCDAAAHNHADQAAYIEPRLAGIAPHFDKWGADGARRVIARPSVGTESA